MATDPVKKTPLYDEHKKLGAKLIDFGGWMLPVSYSSVIKEHEAVRTKAGIFDVSHMGEVVVTGDQALQFVNHLVTNDIERLVDGGALYAAMLNDKGGFVDDLIVYRIEENKLLLCINAANIDKDLAWIREQASDFAVGITDKSPEYAQIALQGPLSNTVLCDLFPEWKAEGVADIDYMTFRVCSYSDQYLIAAKTGYTGETGYEFYIPAGLAPAFWQRLLEHPAVSPCGLGARDTLRLESCYLLYGNDMDETVSPWEAGIGWAVKIDKPGGFVGREALQREKLAGPPRKMVAFRLCEAGVPRKDMQIFKDEKLVGVVTSGSVLPTVGGAGGMALVDSKHVNIGDEVSIDVRGKRKLARIEKRPLYSPKTR